MKQQMRKSPNIGSRKRSSTFALPDTSEDAIARSFAADSEGVFCFVRDWSSWLWWDGSSWKRPAQDRVIEAIRTRCRKLALEQQDPRKAERLLSRQKICAVEMLARSDATLSANGNIWDVDPWVLNTPTGVIDLRSGETFPHDPGNRLLRRTGASAQGDCPRWQQFLNTVSGNRPDLVEYLQRIAGYWLTGRTSEQVFFYFWGLGANGKSVFASTIVQVMGNYAVAAAPGMLTVSNGDRHPTEIAMLQGTRLVVASEIEKGALLAENKLKMLTGSDRLTARRMHEDFTEFDPTFKLLMTGNGLPNFRDCGEAIRRRLHIVPFDVTIPEEQRNGKLMDELLQEADGILQWMLEGCFAWQRHGLSMPACVRELTNAQIDRLDPVGRFIVSCCEVGPSHSCGSTELYERWLEWSQSDCGAVRTHKAFVSALLERGFRRTQTSERRLISGLRLKADSRDPAQ